jgi:hypothetical protein
MFKQVFSYIQAYIIILQFCDCLWKNSKVTMIPCVMQTDILREKPSEICWITIRLGLSSDSSSQWSSMEGALLIHLGHNLPIRKILLIQSWTPHQVKLQITLTQYSFGGYTINPLELELSALCALQKTPGLNGHPLLYMFLANDLGGHLLSQHHYLRTTVDFQHQRV